MILSLPFIVPDCCTLAACRTADAPRGMTIEPPIITGSSTTALNVCPACDESTSIAWVRRTLIAVPAGIVTTDRAGWRSIRGPRPRRSAGDGAGRRRRLPRVELDGDGVVEPNLGHSAVVQQDANRLAVAADEHALHDLARSQTDTIGAERRARRHDEHARQSLDWFGVSCVGLLSLDNRKRGRDLQVDDQEAAAARSAGSGAPCAATTLS